MPPSHMCSFSRGGSWPSLLLALLRVTSVTAFLMEERQVKMIGRGAQRTLSNGAISAWHADRFPLNMNQILWVDFQQQVVVANYKEKHATVVSEVKNAKPNSY